jgi:hypothetical protein
MSIPPNEWLAGASLAPAAVLRTWATDSLAALPSGRLWQVVEADMLRSVEAMQRIRPEELGPVLVYPEAGRAWWLVPLGADALLTDIHCLTVHDTGWHLRCPPADRYFNGRCWLEKPDGTGRLTDPSTLGAAFKPIGTLPAEAFG